MNAVFSGMYARSFWRSGWAQSWVRATSTSAVAEPPAWQVVVGLEMHVCINANSKLFSAAPATSSMAPNTQVALFDAAIPGTLPKLNWACVEAAARTGLALGGAVQRVSRFDRKHYFYADLPHGYQITQQAAPVVLGGVLEVPLDGAPAPLTVHIQRIQLEVDTGKSMHEGGETLVDLNRAGAPLMEVVTEPDMRSGVEAAAFVRQFQRLVRHLGTSTANMEDGSLRVDVNVSVQGAGGQRSERCEVKNLNSTRAIARAIDYEARRHREALESGENVSRETRTFDVSTGATVLLRDKETALDYRFMPDPDLPALVLSEETVRALSESLPVMPDESDAATQSMLQEVYDIPGQQSGVLIRIPGAVAYLEALLAGGAGGCAPSDVAKWVLGDIQKELKALHGDYTDLPPGAQPHRVAEVLQLVGSGQVSGRQMKALLTHVIRSPDDTRPVAAIAEEVCSGGQLSTDTDLHDICVQVLQEYPKQVEDYLKGRDRLMGLFVGQVMKRTQGRADPKRVPALLKDIITASTKD